MEPSELAGLKFYTADVTALFTNVNVETSINDIIEFASEYWDQVDTYGLKLVDLHQILETILSNSFFTFNRRLYKQIFGAFIGCSISPPIAIIRVHVLEKHNIFTDLHITTGIRQYYKRYVDDMSSLARNKEEAVKNCERTSDEDQDRRIFWEVEFPDIGEYVPFLDAVSSGPEKKEYSMCIMDKMLVNNGYSKPR